MAFTIPNEADAGFGEQAELHSRDIDILVAGYGLTGVLSGGAVTAQGTPDNTVAVTAGTGLTTGDYVTWTTGNVTMTAADATNPRFDLVYVTSGGTKTYLAGTADTNPTPPALPAGGIALAVLYTPANDNVINTTQIVDKRVILRERPASLTFIIDGGGAAITTGVKGDVRVPFTCAVTGWDLVADASGSIVIDVWRDTYANFPPTVADTIAGTEKPTLSAVAKNQDTSLTTWATALTEGDWLRFNVDSAATVQRVSLALYLKRT
jgi:hypothetical protein